jgi:hypothetical protein
MRDEQEQLEFIGIEQNENGFVARLRNLESRGDRFVDGSEWLANQNLLEIRIASLIRSRSPRNATRAALAAILARVNRESHNV